MKKIIKTGFVPLLFVLGGWTKEVLGGEVGNLLDLSLEELMNVEVTSVGKKAQRLSQTAAAVFVVRQDDIRRSGATNLPDVLRMVPGMQVARIDANKWAVSARGFNGSFANKLLVLIDGRTVYNTAFSGVYWDMQDVMLEDIDRIEVIRGPGATLWGANAVNGVINIISKTAQETQGGLLKLGTGTMERAFGAARYGMQLGDDTHLRVYGKGFGRNSFTTQEGRDANDHWDRGQGGFRLDHRGGDGSTGTLQGDGYEGVVNQNVQQPSLAPLGMILTADSARIAGFNLLGRWRKPLGAGSEFSAQAYYDHTYRNEAFVIQERDTYDLELQHRFALAGWHDVVWGAGYRLTQDKFSTRYQVTFGSPSQDRQLFSAFIQDEMTLIEDRLKLTLGSKFEHNEFTGFEGQPNLRLLWTPSDHHALWGAVSRAVRIPSRAEDDATVTTFVRQSPSPFAGLPIVARVLGNPKFAAEELLAYEIGYRYLPTPRFSVDLALFYNEYRGLRTSDRTQIAPALGLGVILVDGTIINRNHGESYGAELAVDYRPWDRWLLQLGYSYLKMSLRGDSGGAAATERSSPQQQLSLRSSLNLPYNTTFDLWFRYVDRILSGYPEITLAQPVADYATLDARLAWKPRPDLELSLVGQNLLDDQHLEFIQESYGPRPTQIPRSAYLQLDWRF